MYTISNIIKIMQDYTCKPLQLSDQYKNLLILEALSAGHDEMAARKVIRLDPSISIGELWTDCYQKLLAKVKEEYPQTAELTTFEIIVKLLPANTKSLEVFKNKITYLIAQYTDKSILATLKILLSAINHKIKKLHTLQNALERIRNADITTCESFTDKAHQFKKNIKDFKNIAHPKEYEIYSAELVEKEYRKLKYTMQVHKNYNKYRFMDVPSVVPKPMKDLKPLDGDINTDDLLKRCQDLLESLEYQYVQPGAPTEQLFAQILELSYFITEANSLKLAKKEEQYSELPIADMDIELYKSHRKIIVSLLERNNLFYKLTNCLNDWLDAVKIELLVSFLKINPGLASLSAKYFKLDGTIAFPSYYLDGDFPYLAERNPDFNNIWKTYLLLGKLEKMLSNEHKNILTRVANCFSKLKDVKGTPCHADKFLALFYDLCVQIQLRRPARHYVIFPTATTKTVDNSDSITKNLNNEKHFYQQLVSFFQVNKSDARALDKLDATQSTENSLRN